MLEYVSLLEDVRGRTCGETGVVVEKNGNKVLVEFENQDGLVDTRVWLERHQYEKCEYDCR